MKAHDIIEEIQDKRAKFFEKYLEMPNAIEINGEMFNILYNYYLPNDYIIEEMQKEKIYGMDIYFSLLVEKLDDIECYLIKGVKDEHR